jgi:hypothetical protein
MEIAAPPDRTIREAVELRREIGRLKAEIRKRRELLAEKAERLAHIEAEHRAHGVSIVFQKPKL